MPKEQKKCNCSCHWCTLNPSRHDLCNWDCTVPVSDGHEVVTKINQLEKPDPMEWEKRFDEKYTDNFVWWKECAAEASIGDVDVLSLKSFIRSEKEKSYKEGQESGSRGDYGRKMYQMGRKETLREVMGMVEVMRKGEINPDTGMPYYSDFWKGVKEGFNEALFSLQEKLKE